MSEYKPHWLVRWTNSAGEQDEESFSSEQIALTHMTTLLLCGTSPTSIRLYRSVDWDFEIATHVKPAEGKPCA